MVAVVVRDDALPLELRLVTKLMFCNQCRDPNPRNNVRQERKKSKVKTNKRAVNVWRAKGEKAAACDLE